VVESRMSAMSDFSVTTSVIHAGIAAGLHPGAQLYVSINGQVIADLAVGEAAAGREMTTDSLICWLSSGKPITAVAIGKLWEAGRVALDDPIARFIPEFGVNGKEGITIRHCLTHTAGLRAAASAWARANYREIIEQICRANVEPGWLIGKSAGYHVAATWYLLGEIVARVTGRPLADYYREEIFLPQGMKDSWVGMDARTWEENRERLAIMHRTDVSPAVAQNWEGFEMFEFPRPANNARGTVRDLGKFYEGLLNSKSNPGAPGQDSKLETKKSKLLNAQTVEAMTARHRVGAVDQTFKSKIDWGLGFICNSRHYGQTAAPYQFGAHASDRALGHSGNQSSIGMADPEHGLVIALAFNGQPGEPKHDRRVRECLGAIYVDLGLAAV
jgi:CubicO group peptidase (beta-lactamase class C family)